MKERKKKLKKDGTDQIGKMKRRSCRFHRRALLLEIIEPSSARTCVLPALCTPP
jgi:hypothetical protein